MLQILASFFYHEIGIAEIDTCRPGYSRINAGNQMRITFS